MRRYPIKVAIVDDDPSVRKALCRLLNQLYIDAEPFSCGLEFIESLERSCPDYLVLDVRMPQINGWGVVTLLRQMQACIKIIIVTADDDLPAGVVAASGAVAFLTKPIDQTSLLAAIGIEAGTMGLTDTVA